MLVIIRPAGFERFIEELSRLPVDGPRVAWTTVVQVAERQEARAWSTFAGENQS